ncbi:hypothetical protein [Mesorhizobium sp. M0772]|uniref:hypothetical protein n=1 Tax=Mesorhizobium sp. M0772 TaxID=2956998 RepID=UPI003337AAED
MTDAGISYGFHGLSYSHIASQLRIRYGPAAGGKVIVAHLGSGASLCAMNAGISVGVFDIGRPRHEHALRRAHWSPFSTSNPACSECQGYPVIRGR